MRRLGLVLLLVAAPGCLAMPGDRPLPVQVVDAETHQPLPAARVQLAYATTPSPWAALGAAGTAGPDGVARLTLATGGDAAATLEVAALGYLPGEEPVPGETVAALRPAGLFESTDKRPAAVVVALYAEPRPTVDLVLPAGFRGRVRAAVRTVDDPPAAPGQRQFMYEVPASGAVDVIGPPVLRRTFAPDFHLRYADGSPLTQNARESDVGYWWLKAEGDVQVFLVGTVADFEAAVRAGEATTADVRRSSSGPGGGKGGRRGGRRGGGGGG